MSVVSLEFWVFIFVTVLLYFLMPKKIKWIVLLVSSIVFYIISSKVLSIYLFVSVISIYVGALGISKINNIPVTDENKKRNKRNKKIILLIIILINIGMLLYLKYYNFFGEIIGLIVNSKFSIKTILLPLGISYYTLQGISYVVDVYRGKTEADRNIGRLSLFLIFFPQMTMGPISKYSSLANQLYEGHKINYNNFKYGFTLILFGLFKKLVIADRAGMFVNEVFKINTGGLNVVLAIVLYTIEIYAEFSGYMNIITGISKMIGIDLPLNFNRPFFSKSIAEFWRRWHITLGVWLKDYIFYPISLSKYISKIVFFTRKHLPKSASRFIASALPLFFVWFLNGLWHGASIKYIVYGLYYYILMMIGLAFKPLFDKLIAKFNINTESLFYKVFQVLRTILIVLIGMMIFRSKSLGSAWSMFISIFNFSTPFSLFGLHLIDFIVLFVGVSVMLIVGIIGEKGKDPFEVLCKNGSYVQIFVYVFLILSVVIFGIYGYHFNASDFIYGQF
ncbi:MAG: MBOAT family O-acyltransferase [Bacilli bacterium]